MTLIASSPGRVLARKDRLELLRDRRLLTAVLVVVALALAAIAATALRVSAYERDRAAATSMERQSWLAHGARDPHGAAHFSQWAFRPIAAPALLDPGSLPHAGAAIWMEAHAQNPPAVRAVEDRSATLDLGEFSAAWVLQTMAPLLLLVMAAGAVARERERGTLRLMLTTGLSAERVAGAKARGLLTVGALIMAPLLAVAAFAVILSPQTLTADALARTVLWCLAHAAFLGIPVIIAVAVSACARRTAPALLLLISLWLIAVPLAPRAAASLAESLHPTPSGPQFWAAIQADIRDGIDGSGNQAARAKALEAKVLAQYGVARTEDLPISFRGVSLNEGERFSNLVFDRRFAELNAIYDRQRAVMRAVSLVTPLVAMQNLSMALAGTDNAHTQDFARQVETQRRIDIAKLNNDVQANGAGNPDYRADERLWRTIETFAARPTPVGRALGAVWPDILILLAWLTGSIVLLSRASRALGRELV